MQKFRSDIWKSDRQTLCWTPSTETAAKITANLVPISGCNSSIETTFFALAICFVTWQILERKVDASQKILGGNPPIFQYLIKYS